MTKQLKNHMFPIIDTKRSFKF